MTEETFVSDGKLEAKVVSTTQNDKGWYIRLFLHPNDMAEVTKLRYGAVLDIRWREVLNVEVEPIEVEAPGSAAMRAAGREVHKAMAPLREALKPKERFEDLPLVKQAVLRCGDARFIEFVADRVGLSGPEDAPAYVRHYCGVASRSEIKPGTIAATRWHRLNVEYEAWLTDQQYAASRR